MKQGIFLRQMASDATEAVIDVIGVIGWDVGFQQIREILAAIPETVGRVVFDIYSPGGDVWDGNAIIHEIGAMKQETVANVRVAASMATLIAVACDKRTMSANGRWLVHNPWTATQGDAAEFEKRAKELRDAQNEAAAFYAARTGKSADEMLALMDEERWLTAQEAKDFGFVQEIANPFDAAAFAPVREAIEAAGKWPQALAEIPAEPQAVEVQEEVVKDENANTNGAEGDAAVGAPADTVPADDGDYKRGLADGEALGRSQAQKEFEATSTQLMQRLADAEKLSRRYQGERDQLTARLEQAQRNSDERAASLRGELDVATKRLQSLLAGALTFEPAVDTWEDALKACGGMYDKAAKQYPALLEQYRAAQRQKGSK